MGKSFVFDEEIARKFGADAATLLRGFQFWIGLNKSNGRNFKDGRFWVYNSYEAFTEQFTWLSAPQIRRLLDMLVEKQILLKGNFNKHKSDKTNWYAFVDENHWIKEKSPLEKLSIDDSVLPDSAEGFQDGLFSSENGLTNSAEPQGETLTKSADPKVNSSKNSEKGVMKSAEGDKATDGIGSPSDESGSSDLTKSANQGLTKSADHYQLITQLLKTPVINAVNDRAFDSLAFNFSNEEILLEKIKQLFRIHIGQDTDKFNIINLERIKTEITLDPRPMLTRKVCWFIFLKVVHDYPSWGKDFKNVKALLGRISKEKDKYLEALNNEQKKEELEQANVDRKQSEKDDRKKAIAMAEERIEYLRTVIEDHKDIIPARKKVEWEQQFSNKKYIWVESELISLLSDHGITIEGNAA